MFWRCLPAFWLLFDGQKVMKVGYLEKNAKLFLGYKKERRWDALDYF